MCLRSSCGPRAIFTWKTRESTMSSLRVEFSPLRTSVNSRRETDAHRRQTRVRQRVMRISLSRLPEIINGFLETILCPLIPIEAARLIKPISFGVIGVMFSHQPLLFACQFGVQLLGYILPDLGLQRDNSGDFPAV